MKQMNLGRDGNLSVDYTIPFSDNGSAINLAAASNATLSVPKSAKKAFIQIQPGATVLVGTSTITPPTSSFSSANYDINPASRFVNGVEGIDTLHFYAIDAAIIKVSFYGE
jgi:myo-inositol-hexaphosphate 3-phosphohydrolase